MNRNTDATIGPLEARYRRILTLLPAAYRERRGEEMLATLLDGAAGGRRWPSAGEVTSLAALAVRLRVGAPGGSRRAVAAGEVLRRTGLAGLFTFGLWYAAIAVSNLVALFSQRGYYARNIVGHTGTWWLTLGFVQPLVYLGAFTALVLGYRRIGRFLGVTQVALVVAKLVQDQYMISSDRTALLAVALLIVISIGWGFHRETPPLPSPRRWLTVAAALTGFITIIAAVSSGIDFNVYTGQSEVIDTIVRLVAGPMLPASAVVFGMVQARRSPIWPAALLLLGAPGLLLMPRAVVIYVEGKSENLFVGDLFAGTPWPGMAAYLAIMDALLAAALVWALYRRHTRSSAIAA